MICVNGNRHVVPGLCGRLYAFFPYYGKYDEFLSGVGCKAHYDDM